MFQMAISHSWSYSKLEFFSACSIDPPAGRFTCHKVQDFKCYAKVFLGIRVTQLAKDMFGLHHNLYTHQVAGKKLGHRAERKTALTSDGSETKVSIEVEQGRG